MRIIICISGRHAIHACKQGTTGSDSPIYLQAVRSPVTDRQYEEIPPDPNRIFGVSNQLLCLTSLSTTREEQEDATQSTDTPQMLNLTSKGTGNVHIGKAEGLHRITEPCRWV